MRLDTMLATVDDSPDIAVDGNADLKLDISSATERAVAESVSQELDYWEKLVFSFDMDRDPGGPSQSDTGSRGRGKRSESRSQSQGRGASPLNPGQSSSRSGIGQQPLDPRQLPPLQFPPNIASASGQQQQHPYLSQLSQLPGLDPYTLAQLAALSAIQTGQHAPGAQQQNLPDPITLLRQVQGLLYPYGNIPPGSGGPLSGSSQGFQPAQQGPSRHPSGGPSYGGAQHGMQHSLSESSVHRWPPPQLPGIGSFQFPVPPIDPSLASQLPPLSLPSASQQPAQTPGASPSTEGSRARSRSTASSTTPSTPVSPGASRGQSLMDEAAIAEDKRRRNTVASARFRIKKKHKTLALERSVVELESRADDLEREASDLRRENGWLKEMLIMKGRGARAQAAAAAAELKEAQEEEEEEEEEDDNLEGEGEEGEAEESSDKKGKGKARGS